MKGWLGRAAASTAARGEQGTGLALESLVRPAEPRRPDRFQSPEEPYPDCAERGTESRN